MSGAVDGLPRRFVNLTLAALVGGAGIAACAYGAERSTSYAGMSLFIETVGGRFGGALCTCALLPGTPFAGAWCCILFLWLLAIAVAVLHGYLDG